MDLNARLPRIDASRFAMIPSTEIPRSTFTAPHSLKTTMDFGKLVPIYVDEVLPGDVHQGELTIFARLATPLFPIMDSMTIETFFFFVPNRLVWDNWVKMMGEQANPGDSISYSIPQLESPTHGFAPLSVFDYFGLPTVGQLTTGQKKMVNVLPLRAYNLIWNEWFRDENLQNRVEVIKDNGPDNLVYYDLFSRNKRHDYFTSALPWPLKGGVDVNLPLGGMAPVKGIAFNETQIATVGAPGTAGNETDGSGGDTATWAGYTSITGADRVYMRTVGGGADQFPEIYADLSTATGATINALRLAVQTQRLLERDARGGTRYTEQLRAHWGVTTQDSRLQRPEYIGGGRAYIQTQAIPQTSATGLTGGTTPLGGLGAAATATDRHTFHFNAPEHGYIIGIAEASAEITYQQGLHRMWTRRTRYDFYVPAFAHLGEQAIRNDEIYVQGDGIPADQQVFGYQERWAEYRYKQSRVTGMFRSTTAGNIDTWHLAQEFSALPTLNSQFLVDNPPIARVVAAGSLAAGQQILFDSHFRVKMTRAMPMYSVPGMMDRF